MSPPSSHKGHFYFAGVGHSHFAATVVGTRLDSRHWLLYSRGSRERRTHDPAREHGASYRSRRSRAPLASRVPSLVLVAAAPRGVRRHSGFPGDADAGQEGLFREPGEAFVLQGGKTAIAVSLTEETTAAVVDRMAALAPVADLFEVRADHLRNPDLGALLAARTKPILFTCRSESEGGRFPDRDREALGRLLCAAAARGFDLVDVEERS